MYLCFVPLGEDLAYYFGWMNFYTLCIIAPAIVGAAMYLFRSPDDTVDTDPYLPLFSVVMAIWGVLFLVVSGTVYYRYNILYKVCMYIDSMSIDDKSQSSWYGC